MQQTQSSQFKALSITFLAFLIGQIILTLIFLFVVYNQGFSPNPSNGNLFIILSAAFGAAGYLGGSVLFRKKVEQINGNMKSISDKFNDYRNASINRWAMMEFPILFSLILFFISKYNIIFAISAILLVLFLTLRPSLQKTAADLNVSEIEIEQINSEKDSVE